MTSRASPVPTTIGGWGDRFHPMVYLVVGFVLAVALGPKPQGGEARLRFRRLCIPRRRCHSDLALLPHLPHGVRFDDCGITIRKLFRTNRITWPEVSHFADGQIVWGGENGGRWWALKIVLHDGRAVTAQATMRIP